MESETASWLDRRYATAGSVETILEERLAAGCDWVGEWKLWKGGSGGQQATGRAAAASKSLRTQHYSSGGCAGTEPLLVQVPGRH
jgi:hypothetical protein